MTDINLVFEDPPKKSRRSEHWDYLLALKEHPGKFARRPEGNLTEKAANALANTLRTAATAIGAGWEVTARRLPDSAGEYGVWVKYESVAGDQPPTEEEALAEARELITDAVKEGRPDLDDLDPIGNDDEWETGTVTGNGTGQALPPIADDNVHLARTSD